MKLRHLSITGLILMLALKVVAQPVQEEQSNPTAPQTHYSSDQLDKMLGPIALYPDALVALILPASTVPSDVVLAARFLAQQGDVSKADVQPWEDSVKSLVHYPDVLSWMDENLAWTRQLGDAFVAQPADVMSTVQRLRAKAKAAGTLVDTPQQQVVQEDQNIAIVPAQADVIYVPSYDPEYVYETRYGYYGDPFVTFGIGYPTGLWLGYDLDWGHRRVWAIDSRDRERYWRERHDWRRPVFPGRPGYVRDPGRHPWHPSPGYPRPAGPTRTAINRPQPLPHPYNNSGGYRRDDNHGTRGDGGARDRQNSDANDRDSRRTRESTPNDVRAGQATPSPRPRVTDPLQRVAGPRGEQPRSTPQPRTPVPTQTERFSAPSPAPSGNNAPPQPVRREVPTGQPQTAVDRGRAESPYGYTRGAVPPTVTPSRVVPAPARSTPAPAPASREVRQSAPPPQQARQPARDSSNDNSDRSRQSRH